MPALSLTYATKGSVLKSMIIIQCNQIQEITKQSVSYIDVLGNDAFIDFHTCYLNYLRPRLTYKAYIKFKELNPKFNFNPQRYVDRITSYKQVGQRNSIGGFSGFTPNMIYEGTGQPYIIFSNTPITILECEGGDDFWEIVVKVGKFGWQLWDET